MAALQNWHGDRTDDLVHAEGSNCWRRSRTVDEVSKEGRVAAGIGAMLVKYAKQQHAQLRPGGGTALCGAASQTGDTQLLQELQSLHLTRRRWLGVLTHHILHSFLPGREAARSW